MRSKRKRISRTGMALGSSLIAVWLAGAPVPAAGQEPARQEPSLESLDEVKSAMAAVKQEQLDVAARVLKDFPNDHDALGTMGNAYADQGRLSEAMNYWRRSLKINPNQPIVYHNIAHNLQSTNRQEEAIKAWRKLIQLGGRSPMIYNSLADSLMMVGQTNEAIRLLEKQFPRSSQNEQTHFLLGRGYLQLREYEKAREHYEAVVAVDPKHRNAHYCLVTVFTRLGNKDRSRQHMAKFKELAQTALASNPNAMEWANRHLQELRKNAAGSYLVAGQIYQAHGYMWKAEKDWRRGVAVNPKDRSCRMELATLAMRYGRTDEAQRIYQQLIDIAPDTPRHYLQKARLHAYLKQFNSAQQVLQLLIERLPERADGYYAMATLYLDSGYPGTGQEVAEAQRLAAKAVELQTTAANYSLLGRACENNDDQAGALEALSEALRLDPDNATYQKRLQQIQDNQ